MSHLKASARYVQRAPLVGVAVVFAGGIVAGRYADVPLGFWMVIGFAAIVAAAVTFTRKHLRLLTSITVAAAVLAVAAAHVHTAFFAMGKDHVVTYAPDGSILASLCGQVVTSPMRFSDRTKMGYKRPDQTAFILRAEQIRTKSGWRAVRGLVRVTIREPADHLAAGQSVELVGRIGRYHPPQNPGQFDRSAAARRNGTLVWMTVPAPDGTNVLSGANPPWYSRMYWNLRSAIRQHIAALGDPQDTTLLSALIIGERHPALGKLNRAMARAGIAHFLSISGLHLGVFLGFVYLLLRVCMLSPRRSAFIVLAVLGAYVLLTVPRAPLLRSGLMAAALCAATISRRRYSALNALAAAAIILLALDPLQLFAPGFQLSFAIVGGIILLHYPVRRRIFGRWIRRRGLIVFRTDQSFRRWMTYRLSNWAMDGFVIALVAYAGAAPLVAYHFGLFTPYAIFLSVLLFPLVSAVLIPGYASLGLLWALPGLSHTLGRVASGAANCLSTVVNALSDVPGMTFDLHPLPLGWVVLCYLTLGLIVLGPRIPFGRILGATGAIALCVWTVVSQVPADPPPVAEFHMLAVGSGQCALLRTPSGRTVILDAGTQGGYDAFEQVIRPAILNQRLGKPRQAFISHANTDHFNAVPAMIRNGLIRRVYLNEYFGRRRPSPSLTESAPSEFMKLLNDSGAEIVRLRAGCNVELDSRTHVEVLWPPAGRSDLSVNDTSLVLRITCDDRSMLLTGDLGAPGQLALLTDPRLKSDILVLPHHGGWEESLPEFFDAVDPKIVLVSHYRDPRLPEEFEGETFAADGSTSSPRIESTAARGDRRARFYAHMYRSSRYYSTGRDGWIRIRFGRGDIDVETMRQRISGSSSRSRKR